MGLGAGCIELKEQKTLSFSGTYSLRGEADIKQAQTKIFHK